MSQQEKNNEIVIPPRYETLGRSRPHPANNSSRNNVPPLPGYGSPNYNSSPGLMAFQRLPQNPQVRQSYQSPPPSRMSHMSTTGSNYINSQNIQSSYRQASPNLTGVQVPRYPLRNTRGIQNSSSPNNTPPSYYPVIPTRDISRHKTVSPSTSTIRKHSPSSSVTSLKNIVNNDTSSYYVPRSNTVSNDVIRGHTPKNSISSLFSEDASKSVIEEPVIPLRGKGSLSSLNGSKTSNNDYNRSRSPSVPISENSHPYHHSRSQSYTSVLVNNIKTNVKVRSNSSGNTTNNSNSNIYNSVINNNNKTKSEDNITYKTPHLNPNPILVDNETEYDSPSDSPTIGHAKPFSPHMTAINESFVSQGSPIFGPSSPIDGNKRDIVIPSRRGNYKTQSIYSNFSVMTTTGEVMEYQGIQNLDTVAIEEMLKNGAFSSENLSQGINNAAHELITQPIIEESSQEAQPIVIPVRTSASKHPKTEHQDSTKSSTHSISSSNSNNLSAVQSTENVAEEEEEEEPGIIDHSALLSEIAEEFITAIPLMKLEKDSIEYTDCFTGTDAVNTITSILGTKNRKLAVAIGRSLESQFLFHDVLYTSNLEDDEEHIYQMQLRSNMGYHRDSRLDLSSIIGDYINDDDNSFYSEQEEATATTTSPKQKSTEISESIDSPTQPASTPNSVEEDEECLNTQMELPSGVFVAISSCYSLTCTKDSPCYSYTCPRRRAYNLKSSVKDSKNMTNMDDDNAWSTTVDKNVLEKVDDHERKRQEVIYEFIQSEKEYVDDLISVVKLIRRPLLEGIVPKIDPRFVNIVFSNIEEILNVNAPFSQLLQNLQKQNSIIDRLGDMTQEYVKKFTCYIKYGEIQPLAKEVLQYQRNTNHSLETFLKEMQSRKEFRRLPLESFLARPTTRLGRYPILIKDILKHTKEDHPDQKSLTATMETIQNILKQVNEKAGQTTNKIKLDQWAKSLDQSTMEKIEDILILKLNSPHRNFIREGTLLLKRDGTTPQEVDIVFLDNALVITRKKVNTIEIIRKPIPTLLMKLINHEDQDKYNNKNLPFNEKRFTFSIVHMGFKTYTFMTKVYSEQKSWVETIEEKLRQSQRNCIELFNIYSCHLKINSAVVVKDNVMIFANENGLYTNMGNTLTMILPLQRITNIDIMPDAGLLFVLIDKEVIPYSIDALLKGDLVSNFKKPRKLCSGITFMKIGFCDNHHLLCAVKTANTNSTVRSYEPNQPLIDAISAKTINKKVSTIDVLIPHKQFYIPAEAKSIQFLKRALCIGCTKGFEVVNINTLTTQSLFDTHDPAYEWIIKAEYNPIKLIKTSKGDFLVCYNKVGFFLDKNGNPSRGNIRFFWMNPANSFAYISPYILAISHEYIEVWDENEPDTVKQIVYGYNIRLFTSYTGDAVYIISGNDMHLISRIILSRKRVA